METQSEIATLIERIRTAESSFYRDHWGNETRFEQLPVMNRAIFVRTALSRRRYKDDGALVKTVRSTDGMFLSEWSFDDIAAESLGPVGERPMVYMEDADEALHQSLWCYEHARLPLIGETVPEIANSAADFYDIDSLVADEQSIRKLLPHLRRRLRPLLYLNIVGTFFGADAMREFSKYAAHITLILGLPETGVFASAPYSEAPVFSPLPGCFIEAGTRPLLTRTAFFTTPIVRYELPIDPAIRFTETI